VSIPGPGRSDVPTEVNARRIEQHVLPLRPDLVVTTGPTLTRGLVLAAPSVPVVTKVPDPVDAGFAKSFARPGGSVTGLAEGIEDTAIKSVELLRQLVPRARRVAVFAGPSFAATRVNAHYERAVRDAGLEPVMVLSKSLPELWAAMPGLPAKGIPAGLWAWPVGNRARTAREAVAAGVALIGPDDEWVEAGCLASYHAFEPAPYARMAAVAAQLLRGARPADTPFQLPQHFRLAINRTTASAIGILLSGELLLRADRVIG
jgi:putative ABC transport system substrate-binding protein